MALSLHVLQTNHAVQLPSDKLNFMLVQPAASLETTDRHQLTEESAASQMALLRNVVDLAERKGAHFIVFPEYALPGESWREILTTVRGLPDNSVLIAGLDAVGYETYLDMAAGTQTARARATLDRHRDEWVNCGLVVVKGQGQIEYVVQPKLIPAKPEQGQVGGMFEGDQVAVLQVDNYRLGLLICRDLIHRVPVRDPAGAEVWTDVADWLNGQLRSRRVQLDFLFVIQDNQKPAYDRFLKAKARLLAGQVSCLVAVNHSPHGGTGLYVPEERYVVSRSAPFSFGVAHPTDKALPLLARAHSPHLFFLRHRPLAGIVGQVNMVAIDPIAEYELVGDQLAGDGPLRPVYYWAFKDLVERHPDKDREPIPVDEIKRELKQHYESIRQQFADVSKAAHIETVLQVLMGSATETEYEPLRWAEKQKSAVGHMVRTLATLRLACQVKVAPGTPAITAELAAEQAGQKPPIKFAAVLRGDPELSPQTSIKQYVSAYGERFPGSAFVVLLDHKHVKQEFPMVAQISGFSRERIDSVQVHLKEIDKGLPSGGETDRQFDQRTAPLPLIDEKAAQLPPLYYHSGRVLDSYLNDIPCKVRLREKIYGDVTV